LTLPGVYIRPVNIECIDFSFLIHYENSVPIERWDQMYFIQADLIPA